MGKTRPPKFDVKELEKVARLARVNYLLGTNFKSLDKSIHLELPRGGGQFGDVIRPLEYTLIQLLGQYFWDTTDSDSGRSPTYGEMHVEFSHTLDIVPKSGKIEIETRAFVADENNKPHALFYMLDQGIPPTTFPDGSALFPVRAEERSSSKGVNPVKPAYLKVKYKVVTINGQKVQQIVGYERTRDVDEATKVRIEPGETRPAIPARRWSEQTATRFAREFDPNITFGGWTLKAEAVEFKG